MNKFRRSYLLLVVVLVLGLGLTACGKKTTKKEATPTPTVEPTVEPTAQPTVEPTVEPTIAPTAQPTVTESVEGTPEGTEIPATLTGVTGDPVAGKALFESQGCAQCHNVDTDQTKVGPSLKGIGSEAAEGEIDGHPALDYLHQSIVDPGAVIVEGFQNVMPSFKDKLTEAQIQDIIAYLLTLTD
jgi:mono/diheme cytochrome c family protein